MYDLIVAGGGLSGVASAVSAARLGASVCLIERKSYLGGLATGGLVNPFMTHKTKDGKTKLVAGLFDEIKVRLSKEKGILGNCFDSIAMKKVLLDMALGEKIDLFLEEEIISCNKKEIFTIKTDKHTFQSEKLIDATGDGFVAYSLGCEYEGGDKGNTQAVTLMFTMENVDCAKAIQYSIDNPNEFLFPKYEPSETPESVMKGPWSLAGFYSIIEEHREEAKFPGDMLFFVALPKNDQVTFNQTHTSMNNSTDKVEIEKAYKECEEQVYSVVDFVRKYIPGFENATLLEKADILGVREGRRIMGEYVFSEEDILFGKKHYDSICKLAYPVDVHKSNGEGYSKAEGEKKVPETKPNDWYEIPFRSLKTNIENLLVVGKCVSSNQAGHGAIRIMPSCIATGQAAGTAVAISSKKNISINHIEISELLDVLRENKALV